MNPTEPPGGEPPPTHSPHDDDMNIDPATSPIIADTSLEPPVLPFPLEGAADSRPAVAGTPTTDTEARLPNVGSSHYVLHPVLNVPVHSHECKECTAFIEHQDPSHPSWPHVQEQFRIRQRAQYDSGISRGLAFASERIATAEGIRRRAEENVLRLTRQRDIARDSEAAAQERLTELQTQLETIRLEHAALVRDHAHTEQALDRARAPSRTRSPTGESSSVASSRRRSPRPDAKKRKRSSPPRSLTSERRPASPSSRTTGRRAPQAHGPPRASAGAPTHPPTSWTSTARSDIRGAQWAVWVPITGDDVTFAFTRATTDAHASARLRTLYLEACDLAAADRTPVMRFLVQQWGIYRNTLTAPLASHSPPSPPTSSSNGGGRGRPPSVPLDSHRGNRDPASSRATAPASTPNAWNIVTHGKNRSAPTQKPAAPSNNGQQSTTTPIAKTRGPKTPAYASHVGDWVNFLQVNPDRCPRGVPMLTEGPLAGTPMVRLLERHLELRLNGPAGRDDTQRTNRGYWVMRTTELFSIRGLYERVLHKEHIPVIGSVATVRPYTGDARNLTIVNVARHFANNGYQPRSLAVTEFQEYAAGRRNVTEGRPRMSTEEWVTPPTLAAMNIAYPPLHAAPPSAGPPRNIYPNRSLDLRAANTAARSTTPEGPALVHSSGTMSPDFPLHYVPPTPHSVPLSDELAGALPLESRSWADDDFAVNNSLGMSSVPPVVQSSIDVAQDPSVNNLGTDHSTVDPASVPIPPSRSATPMDSEE
ncbi:hypothetical protein FA95DRAFT_1613320 [Auriscalpium vulgare]|uniref:Uncharacterized protein n=1 Tax=Auriscalpium vulgare TaxID=40419 RepID=A0ACB8R3F7_9AGAM|nr:hypothetical protein FA95DRAFT_1613320 [Auriscalpium vulgare]